MMRDRVARDACARLVPVRWARPALAIALLGCSSPLAGDVSSSGHAPAAPHDAGVLPHGNAVDDPGSEIYPAPHAPMPQLKSLGGPILVKPKLVTVTFVGDERR